MSHVSYIIQLPKTAITALRAAAGGLSMGTRIFRTAQLGLAKTRTVLKKISGSEMLPIKRVVTNLYSFQNTFFIVLRKARMQGLNRFLALMVLSSLSCRTAQKKIYRITLRIRLRTCIKKAVT
ncbi:hypothetical protein ID11_18660 (plasmid) [Pantoea vagans]|nr:hypothetical protein ID11_18660 [Pantoea vagans]